MRTNNATRNVCKNSSHLFDMAFGALLGIAVLIGARNAVAKDWVSSMFGTPGVITAIEKAAALPKLPPEWRFEKKPLNLDHMFPAAKSTSK